MAELPAEDGVGVARDSHGVGPEGERPLLPVGAQNDPYTQRQGIEPKHSAPTHTDTHTHSPNKTPTFRSMASYWAGKRHGRINRVFKAVDS